MCILRHYVGLIDTVINVYRCQPVIHLISYWHFATVMRFLIILHGAFLPTEWILFFCFFPQIVQWLKASHSFLKQQWKMA